MKDVLDLLLDKDCCPLILTGDNGEETVFEKVAVLTKNDRLYCILKPFTPMAGVAEDEAVVFYVDKINGEHVIVPERDNAAIEDVFSYYCSLIEQYVKKNRRE